MSRIASRRLLAQSPHSLIPDTVPGFRLPLRYLRQFSSTSRRKADEDDTKKPPSELQPAAPAAPAPQAYAFPSISQAQPSKPLPPSPSPSLNPRADSMAGLASTFGSMINRNQQGRIERSGRRSNLLNTSQMFSDGNLDGNLLPSELDFRERAHQLHIYATRHNCHITLVRPPGYRNPVNGKVSNNRTNLMSVACGNLAFRHTARKHYDSAFQLASYVMGVLKSRGHANTIEQLEVFLRGFGAGREAVTRALLGLEGAWLRGKIVKVSDATRLKFGGTRSKKPRRLG